MIGGKLEIFALTLWLGKQSYHPAVWLTHMDPLVGRDLVLK
jgi:hypothetical protein